MFMTQIRIGIVLLLALCCTVPAKAKRLKPQAELVPRPARPEMQVGSMHLHRCKEAPAYCGILSRPLDPTGAVLGSIDIGFQFYPHLDSTAAPLETIVATEGGPGYSTTDTRHSYIGLFRPLMDRHDLLLMDDRGTGMSQAVDCRLLQREPNVQPDGVAACGAQMGKAAYLYGGAFAADDLAAILEVLGIRRIYLYGDSYGTIFSQIFATRHPEKLRALILDSAFPAVGLSPWYPELAPTVREAFRLVCERSRSCRSLPGDSRHRIEELVAQVRQNPFSGKAQDGEGKLQEVNANPSSIAYLMYGNALSLMVYRELDAAARDFLEQHDRRPLLRLLAENQSFGESGGSDVKLSYYSAAIYLSASCTDYPQIYDMKASLADRTAQLQHALAENQRDGPGIYAPFTVAEFDAVPLDVSVLRMCLNWPPAPAQSNPGYPIAPGTAYPNVPTLVLSGDFDPLTPWPQGQATAKLFPNAQFVVVENSTHVTALSDEDNCGSDMVRNFVQHLDPGDTSCAKRVAEVHLVPKFAQRASELDPATAESGNAGTVEDLRTAAAASQTVGDALARWWMNSSGKGVGLRGGTFVYKTSGSHSLYTFKKLRWTEDVEVSGNADCDYDFPGTVKAHLEIKTSAGEKGELTLTWNSRTADADAQITGKMAGREIRASIYAPF
jgi:pimeloyl-ACP methyl ester carboxylesterase